MLAFGLPARLAMLLAGWGNYPRAECRVINGRGDDELIAHVRRETSVIARGNGRSYGDAALNQNATLSTRKHNRFLDFDAETGRLNVESGVLLTDILDTFVPRGWFPSVTPGTKFVSIGGMIAADVHGKNHHMAGSFCRDVESLRLLRDDGQVVTCSPDENSELFAATCGGMGLTGVILSAVIHLQPIETAWMRKETLRCRNLAEVMEEFERSADWTYSVAWIDCLAHGRSAGRSLLYRGEHARLAELTPEQRRQPFTFPRRRNWRMPFNLPSLALNRFSVSAMNAIYYRLGKPGHKLVDYETYFYPLDSILEWNRMYGRRGLIEYQCVLPKNASAPGLTTLLEAISRAGLGSFLAVLKLFGRQDTGLISFPMEGYTLALDFPVRRATLKLFDELDAIVADHGGRLYLAKDATMPAELFKAGYPKLDEFVAICTGNSDNRRFTSLLSERLGMW